MLKLAGSVLEVCPKAFARQAILSRCPQGGDRIPAVRLLFQDPEEMMGLFDANPELLAQNLPRVEEQSLLKDECDNLHDIGVKV